MRKSALFWLALSFSGLAYSLFACSSGRGLENGAQRSFVNELRRDPTNLLGRPVIMDVFLSRGSSPGEFSISDAFLAIAQPIRATFANRRSREIAKRLNPDTFLSPSPFITRSQAICILGILKRDNRGNYRVAIRDVAEYKRGQACFRMASQ